MKYREDPEERLTDEEKVVVYDTAKYIVDLMREYMVTAKTKKWKKNTSIFEWIHAWDREQKAIIHRRLEKIIERGDQVPLEEYTED